MSQIIADTYEILERIGSGGGGVVYLGRHLRLGKLIVLKADRRTLAAKPEALRREVDALKNLNHTYIPQVYDFVVEDGVVYTVMDYIEGESLDKPLKRGERFAQANVVKWACELLEALCYLHSRPPHGILHADIKPANIMLTPEGDIRLIDFNIALALGEEGAVRVGYSQGYASPEHYGADYSDVAETQVEDAAKTQLSTAADDARTQLDGAVPSAQSSGYSSGRGSVLLDVRSDIYSLGATLYHLFTGRRPAQDARAIVPIGPDEVSPAIAAILRRAMAPAPKDRYQSAAEMLRAFEHLHDDDPRTRRHRRTCRVTAAALATVFLFGGCMTFTGLKRMEQTQSALAKAEYSADALREGDVPRAVCEAYSALQKKPGLLDAPNMPQVERALAAALGVYDLSSGYQALRTIALNSAPIKVALSPNGTRTVVLTAGCFSVFDTDSGALLVQLDADASALSDAVFVNENVLLYAGDGALCCYDLNAQRELWSGRPATGVALSTDGSTAAAVYRDENLAVIYDVVSGEVCKVITFQGKCQSVATNDRFADPCDSIFVLNNDGSYLAASFSDGGLCIFDLNDSAGDLVLYDSSDFTHFEGGFSGDCFAFSATGASKSTFAVIDVLSGEQTGGFTDRMPFRVSASENGVFVALSNLLVRLDPVSGEQTELAYADTGIVDFACCRDYSVVATEDGAISFFNAMAMPLRSYSGDTHNELVYLAGEYAVAACRDVPTLRILKREETVPLFTYDPTYAHDEARVSSDGTTIMLFRYDAFRIYDMEGAVRADAVIPNAEQVYDQQYRRESRGDFFDVIYYDGLVRRYSAADGLVVSLTQGEAPDETLYEEFLTDTLRITSPLHGTPCAYDRKSGALVRELEPDAYLTYVTQLGDLVVTEYITAQGERYGLLLNAACETLADLPGLCDVTAEGMLVFDDQSGNLRQSRIYSTQELMALAEDKTN